MTRVRPPNRRASLTIEVEHTTGFGVVEPFVVHIGAALNRVREVFISHHKLNATLDTLARDSGILLSIALQHGASLPDIAHSLSRETDGRPQTPIGSVVDALLREETAWDEASDAEQIEPSLPLVSRDEEDGA